MGWRGPAPELGGIHPHQGAVQLPEQVLGVRQPAQLEPGAVPELDGEDVVRVPLTGTQHRLTARIAGYEKPKVVWDRPELERLFDRLTEEYEIEDRTETLEGKAANGKAKAAAE